MTGALKDAALNDAALLVALLRDPARAEAVTAEQWTGVLAIARAEALAGTLAVRVAEARMPEGVVASLADHRASAEEGRRVALWEAEMCRRALAPLGIATVLLKGTAYAAADLAAAQGRQIGDLDILVPRDRLAEAEKALRAAGWEWVKEDAYDDAYYRQWMHELPPMIHATRDRMIDVHHTVLPLTARVTPDAAGMLAEVEGVGDVADGAQTSAGGRGTGGATSTPLPLAGGAGGGPVDGTVFRDRPSPDPSHKWEGRLGVREGENSPLYILSPNDRICHAAAHMLADGDLQGGLRNLWDIHCLISKLPDTPHIFSTLEARATHHGLAAPVRRSARLAAHLYGTVIPPEWQALDRFDRALLRRLLARNGWGQETHKFLRLGFYIRSHWLRMPPLMLARHLWTKWRKGATQ